LKSGIIFIGGASGSGKTSAANDLGKKKTLPVLSLDSIYNMFKDVIPKDVRVEKTESVVSDPQFVQLHSLVTRPALPFGLLREIVPQHEQIWVV